MNATVVFDPAETFNLNCSYLRSVCLKFNIECSSFTYVLDEGFNLIFCSSHELVGKTSEFDGQVWKRWRFLRLRLTHREWRLISSAAALTFIAVTFKDPILYGASVVVLSTLLIDAFRFISALAKYRVLKADPDEIDLRMVAGEKIE